MLAVRGTQNSQAQGNGGVQNSAQGTTGPGSTSEWVKDPVPHPNLLQVIMVEIRLGGFLCACVLVGKKIRDSPP